jgi:hypothetical protein
MQALARLPVVQRGILFLFYGEGYRHHEIRIFPVPATFITRSPLI